MDTQRKNKTTLIAAASGIVLSLGLATVAVASGSAADLSNGAMMVRTVDKDGHEGFAGMKPKPGDGSSPGTESPGTDPGTDPGTGNPGGGSNPGTDPGTADPGGGSNPGTENPQPVQDKSALIKSCTVLNDAVTRFDAVQLVWTSDLNNTKQKFEMVGGSATAAVAPAEVTQTGPVAGVYTYHSKISKSMMERMFGKFESGSYKLRVTAGNSTPTEWNFVLNSGMGGNSSCSR